MHTSVIITVSIGSFALLMINASLSGLTLDAIVLSATFGSLMAILCSTAFKCLLSLRFVGLLP